MNVHIEIDAGSADEARAELAKLLGTTAPPPSYAPESALPVAAQAAKVETAPVEQPAARKVRATKKTDEPAPTTQAAISTGDARVDPDNSADAVDDTATAARDAADEAAETAATKAAEPAKALTLDDVRNALGKYVTKFGMDAAQADGPVVIQKVCGDGINKISSIPLDPAVIAKVVAGVKEMTTKNPFDRTPIAG